jgi:hypothetical protein
MRTLLCIVVLVALACGCTSQSRLRGAYVRATLPYETANLVVGANRIRRDYPDVTASGMAPVEQLIVEHALRLHICLSDPHIPEKDKAYGRNVLPLAVGYIATNHVGMGFEIGKEYEMLPGDFMFPSKMKIRDVIDELIRDNK